MDRATIALARQRLARDGFVVVPALVDSRALAEAGAILDPLMDAFRASGRSRALDLAPDSGGQPRIPDLNHMLRVAPALYRTRLFRAAARLSRGLIGAPVFCTFDHAIYKPPRNGAATPWHQDQAYAGFPRALNAVHLWIPLQEATRENGCMWFSPGSHRRGLVPHERAAGTEATLLAVRQPDASPECAPVPAGGASVHLPLTLHMSGPNQTDAPRRAWILHFARYGVLGHLHYRNLAWRLGAMLRRLRTPDRA